MLTVYVAINKKIVSEISAFRIGPEEAKPAAATICRYRLADGRIIEHAYGDGAESLAAKILLASGERKT